ncbi:MAG: metal-sensitive transcriptional regulator [Anaerolineae bacterium]|nr:MAG: metal-sensitive transcriptional regulator [Anaerolineae bacterium]
MPQDQDTKQEAHGRLLSIAGHVNGIVRMLEEDEYCIDIIHQVQAVQAALDKVNVLLLDDYMKHCVSDAIQSQGALGQDRVLNELHAVFAVRSKI